MKNQPSKMYCAVMILLAFSACTSKRKGESQQLLGAFDSRTDSEEWDLSQVRDLKIRKGVISDDFLSELPALRSLDLGEVELVSKQNDFTFPDRLIHLSIFRVKSNVNIVIGPPPTLSISSCHELENRVRFSDMGLKAESLLVSESSVDLQSIINRYESLEALYLFNQKVSGLTTKCKFSLVSVDASVNSGTDLIAFVFSLQGLSRLYLIDCKKEHLQVLDEKILSLDLFKNIDIYVRCDDSLNETLVALEIKWNRKLSIPQDSRLPW